ncbi:TPA: thermonuclease family protein [Pseudomonas aeruginosa]
MALDRGRRRVRATLLLVLSLAAAPAWAELRGEVVRIIDGDTIDVLVDKRPVRVRLVDIDAPEKRQAFGERARQALAGMVFRRPVLVDEKATDRYGRTLGIVWVNVELPGQRPHPRNVNASMVHQGMAWAYRFHGRAADPEMLRLEQEARGKRVGLWSDPNAVEPWKWRRESNNRRDEG